MRTCRKCGISSDEIDFKPRANICKPCNAVYMSEYRKKNRKKLSKQIQNWKDNNREHYRKTCREHYHERGGKMKHRARVEKTPRTWLSHILGAIKAHAAKPGLHDPKSGPKRDFDIDLDYVVELYEAQDGKCAMSGIPMNTKYNDLCSASIDRIDNEQGHVKGNIIIVCKWVNLGRCHHPIEEFKEVLDSLRSILKEETSSDDFKALLDDPDAPDPLPPAPWDKTTPRRGPGRFA